MLQRHLLALALAATLTAPVTCQLEWAVTPPGKSGGALRLVYDSSRQITVGVQKGLSAMEIVESDGGPWRVVPPPAGAPTPRDFAAVAFDANSGRTMLFGGAIGNTPVAETWSWDGTAWTRHTGPGPDARIGAAMAYDPGRRRLVLFGGVGIGNSPRSDTWEWDGTSWSQVQVSPPPFRYGHQMVYDASRQAVLMCGGFRSGSPTSLEVLSYDGTNWSQVSAWGGPEPRIDVGLGYDPLLGQVVLQGGAARTPTGVTAKSDTWTLQGSRWTHHAGAMQLRRLAHQLAWDEGRGRLILFGGSGRAATYAWTGSDWLVEPSRSTPLPQSGLRLLWDSQRQRTLMFGVTPNDRFDLWSRTADGWDLVPGDPTAFGNGLRLTRSNGFAYDSRRGVAVLFGGFGGLTAFRVWEHDGSTWRMSNQSGPVIRENMLFVYDAARGTTVMFGGDINGALADTWEWDGNTWQQRFPATSPSARYAMAGCYDPLRQRIVMFGGSSTGAGNGPGADETWEWDGNTWSRRVTATTPPARAGAGMVYDVARRRAVMVGGNALDDRVWEFDGQDWTARVLSPGLPPRTDFAMVHDPVRGTTIVYGGMDVATRRPVGDTWELAPSDPADTRNFGDSCAGQAFALHADSLPWVGAAFELRATGFAPNTPARVWLGFSDSTWSGGALPTTLDHIGMTGCRLHVSLDVELPMQPGTAATLSIPLPNDPALVGAEFYLQAYGPAPGITPLGAAVTDALAARIGAR